MGPVGKALRYIETLRHLRPVQVINRLKRKVPWFASDPAPSPPLRKLSREWRQSLDHRVRLSGPDTVTLINLPGRIADAAAWNDPAQTKLWLYNLHYFDWMSGKRDASHRSWERNLILRWIAENPEGQGNGWEPYPLSLRIVNWSKWLFEGNDPPPGMLDSLAQQLRSLDSSIEWHLLGNHLLANAKALFTGGALFGGTEGSRWLAKGDRLLSEQWRAQILLDGGHEERSAMYHAILLEDVLDCINMVQSFALTDLRVAEEGPSVAAGMLRWLATMTHPDGSLALFNDSAPGIAAPLAALSHYAIRLGLDGLPRLGDGVIDLAETGYLRVQVGPAVLLADCAPVGPAHQPGHAHADTLGFELSLYGTPVIVSAGTSTYEKGPQRNWERSTAAHNCLVIDGVNSSDVWAGFRVGRRARIIERGVSAARPHVVVAAHDGYRFMPGSPVVRRRWTLDNRSLVIEDQVEGLEAIKSCVVWLHLASSVEAVVEGCFAWFSWSSGRASLVASAPIALTRTTRSLSFNRTTEATSLSWTAAKGASRAELKW